MERVDQTLDRLADIVDEVEVQRTALQSQAKKAAAYREISSELREKWLGLATDDYRLLTATIEASAEQIREIEAEASRLEAERDAAERDLEGVDREMAAVDEQLRDKEREVAALRETVAGHLSTIRLQSTRGDELDTEFLRLKRQRGRLEERVREGDQELEHIATVLADSESETQRLRDAVDAYESQLAELSEGVARQEAELQQQRQSIEHRQRASAEAEQQVRDQNSQRVSQETALESTRQRAAALERQREQTKVELASAARLLGEADAEVESARSRHREIAERRQQLLETQGGHQTSLADLRERRSAAQARLTVLEDLESRQEGIGIGVREILRRSQTSDYAPWNLIAGSVADLIDVDIEHAAILEAALGQRAQLIVIRDFESLIEYLVAHSSQIVGRVGFLEYSPGRAAESAGSVLRRIQLALPFSTDDGGEVSVDDVRPQVPFDLMGRPGVVDRADRLARGRDGFTDLPTHLLADTWVVETLEAARELSEQHPDCCRFVTLQGELLETDGTLTVGALRSETAVVSRKSELRLLKNELMRLERETEREEHRLTEASEQIAAVDEELQVAADSVEEHTAEHAECKSRHTGHERELQRLDAEHADLQAEVESLEQAREELAGGIAAAQGELSQLTEALAEARDGLAAASRKISEQQAQLEDHRARKDAEHLKLVKQQERSQALREAHERARREHRVRVQQRDEAARRLGSAFEQRRDVELTVLQTRAELAELSLAQQQRLVEADVIAAEKDGIRGRRTELARRANVLRNEAGQFQQRAHAAELEAREAHQTRDALVDRIDEEFQADLAEVARTDTSAFQAYLDEQNEIEAEDDSAESGDAEVERLDPDDVFDENCDEEEEPDADLENDDEQPESAGSMLVDPQAGIEFSDIRDELESEVDRLRRKLKALGAVNTDSLRDLDDIEHRFEHLSTTLADLQEAKQNLIDLVRRIDRKCSELFRETFDAIRQNFQELFRRAFGGGDGDVVLEDPDDMLECGIDIVARPPGKELKSITLLSGGEKTLTAFALLLAMFRHNPSPYCVLDEVDAALDEANVDRLRALLQEFKDTTQFVIITHKKPTMAIADRLYGVTMEESGVSKRLTVEFENIGENGEFLGTGDSDGLSSAA